MSVNRPSGICAVAAALMAAVAMVLAGCGPSKNTAMSRNYQAFITRYNIYYNGDTHFKETLSDMESAYEDDYSQLIHLHPVDARSNPKETQPSANFDRSIEKAQKAIQVRSIKKKPARKAGQSSNPAYKAWMKREEYNPFLHNAWMLMGRSQFYNGDFGGAASTFYYISRHFPWLPATVTEARIWQARCYVEMDWLFEAETILRRIKPDELTDKDIKRVYNYTYGDFWLRSKDYSKAIPYLLEALKYSSGAQKTRIHFLLGQLYTRLGDKQRAYAEFAKVSGANSASYRTKFNARIRQSEVYSGSDIEKEVNALKRMTRYDRNSEYLDQVYYAIGNLYLSRGDTARAIENYALAAQKSTRSGVEKAMAQVALGNLYFDLRDYVKAQPCYSEAMPLLPESFPDYRLLRRRSDVLDELAVYAQNVQLQDSLLNLAHMPEEERLKVIDKIIDELNRKEKEEAENAKREEYLANQQAQGNNLQQSSQAPNSFVMNSDNSWYFYNPSTRNAGKAEFQRRWGSRKLEDDWRRRNKATFSMADFDTSDDEENPDDEDSTVDTEAPADSASVAADRASDPHYPEYYLSQIPLTPEQQAVAKEIIQEGLYNMGIILKDKLEDYNAARDAFDRLLTEFPDNIYRLDVYYNLYLMYVRDGREDLAEHYRRLIISDFPESNYGIAMKNPDYLKNLREMDTVQQTLYDETYQAYLDNRNDEVHAAYERMAAEYPLSKIMPKFMFLHALAYVTEKRPDEFNSVLRQMLERYPDTDIAPVASAWLKGMAQGRKLNEGAANLRGMIWGTRLSNDSLASETADSIAFTVNPESPQLLVLLFPTDKVSSNTLLYDVASFNFYTFLVKDFDLEQMNFGQLGMLIISGFDNQAQLNHYRSVMAGDHGLTLPADVRPIEISRENFDKLLHEGGSFEQYFKFINDEQYRTHLEYEEEGSESDGPPPADSPVPVATEEPDAETPPDDDSTDD